MGRLSQHREEHCAQALEVFFAGFRGQKNDPLFNLAAGGNEDNECLPGAKAHELDVADRGV